MDIDNATVTHDKLRFGQTIVGTDAVQLTTAPNSVVLSFKTLRGILVRALGSSAESNSGQPVNTHPVWIGGEGVTPETGTAIPPGNAIVIPVDDPSKLWVISTGISQRVSWISL